MISFVVPAYNEERLLGATLDALVAAAHEGTSGEAFEIVVADDGSTDATASIAQAKGARVVTVHHRQISRTRNSGARATAGDVLVFVDADTLVSGATLRAALGALSGGAVGGGAHVRFEGRLPLYGRMLVPLVRVVMHRFTLSAGCFLFCTREAFDRAGGFDESVYAAEEIYLSRALKRLGRIVILDEEVETSGRRVRSFGNREFLAWAARMALRGTAGVRTRDDLAWWYADR